MQEKKAVSSRGRGRLRGFLELRRPWGFPTPVFLSRESCGQGNLEGCHLWGLTESDMTEVT